jgi:hypothetical protein
MKNLWKLIHTSNLCVFYIDSLLKYNTVKLVSVGHLWFHSKPTNVYRQQIYGNHYTMKIWTVHYSLCKCILQSAETSAWVGMLIPNPVNEYGLEVQ